MSDIGHNDPAAARALEGIREYQAGVTKEQAGRDDAVAGIIKYGAGLIESRAGKSNNEFGDWIKAQGLDQDRLFSLRQERSAAIQIAEIAAHVVQETVDSSTTVNPFAHCPHNRPTNIMTWWRGKHSSLLTMAHAKTVGERAAKILQAHRDRIEDPVAIEFMEALARDPYAVLITSSVYEEAVAELEIKFGLRPAPPKPAAASATPSPVQAAPPPPTAQKPVSPPPDRVQKAADSAEIGTLKKEVWRLRDKLEQLATFLVEKPPPKAEDRPFVQYRYRLPETIERRPKDVPPKDIVDPVTDDPAFALRKEEFEQWLVRRREALEYKFRAREDELKKAFDAKVRDKVEAQMAREDRPGRIGEFRRLATKLATYFHTDKRKRMTDQDWDRAFSEFMSLRNLIIPPKNKGKKGNAASPVAPDPAPEPPQEERPPTGALS